MNLIINIFNKILYYPLFNTLVLLYQYLPGKDLGIAIIFLTILTKALFYPLNKKAIKAQKVFQDIQPKIQEIQKKYKDNKEKLVQETMELYQKAKINPFSSLLPLIIQFPILIALFFVFKTFENGLSPAELGVLYSFIPRPESINPMFLGKINLTLASIPLAISAGIFQFIQTKMTSLKTSKTQEKDVVNQFTALAQKQMLYFFPVLTILILLRLPSAIGLYWSVSTIFSIIQQYFTLKKHPV